jgi:hypothetical protein
MIVARHEVPGKRWREPRPGGTAEVVVNPRDICRRNEVHDTLETLGIPVERYVGV